MTLVEAHDREHLPEVRELFREYAQDIGVDLCFQGFERELAELPGRYAPPDGRLLLAREHGEPVGCVALRKIDHGICEIAEPARVSPLLTSIRQNEAGGAGSPRNRSELMAEE